jgi:transcriptional regulator with XRE-family HTH domain
MSQPQLAQASGVSLSTVGNFESGLRRNVTPQKVVAIRHALEREGIVFDGNGGVKLRKGRK